MSKALTRRTVNLLERARSGALVNMLAEVAENDTAVAMAASRAAEIDTVEAGQALLALPVAELQRLGWASREELRIAIDAKKCTRETPFYMRMSHERTLMRYRGQEGDRPQRAVIVTPNEPVEPATSTEDPPLLLPEGDDETPG
jgi:hypothetical protein